MKTIQKYKKIMSILLTLVCVCSILSGCTKNNTNLQVMQGLDNDEIPPLKVSFYGVDGKTIVEDYNLFAPQEEEAWANDGFTELYDSENPNQQTLLSILTDSAPDLYFFANDFGGIFGTLLAENMFADLNPYLQQDTTIDLSEYESRALQLGQKNGKQLFIPLAMQIFSAMTTQEKLDKAGFSEDPVLSMENLPTLYEQVQSPDQFLPIGLIRNPSTWFYDLLWSDFVNEANNQCSFTSELFQNRLSGYQQYQDRLSQAYGWSEGLINQANSSIELFFAQMDYGDPNSVYKQYQQMKRKQEGTPRIFAVHDTKDPKGYAAVATSVIAMNRSCQQKDLAYKMIAFLLSEEYQQGYQELGTNNLNGIPIHKQAQKTMFENSKGNVRVNQEELQSFTREYQDIVENITSCSMFCNYGYINRLYDPLYQDFSKGKLNLKQFCNQLQNKTQLFLMEN